MGRIFVITVLTEARPGFVATRAGEVRPVPSTREHRSWGWYAERGFARDAVHRNLTDLHEGTYDWAVIEEVAEGVCPEILSEEWFRFDREANGYRPADKPADLAGTVAFSLG